MALLRSNSNRLVIPRRRDTNAQIWHADDLPFLHDEYDETGGNLWQDALAESGKCIIRDIAEGKCSGGIIDSHYVPRAHLDSTKAIIRIQPSMQKMNSEGFIDHNFDDVHKYLTREASGEFLEHFVRPATAAHFTYRFSCKQHDSQFFRPIDKVDYMHSLSERQCALFAIRAVATQYAQFMAHSLLWSKRALRGYDVRYAALRLEHCRSQQKSMQYMLDMIRRGDVEHRIIDLKNPAVFGVACFDRQPDDCISVENERRAKLPSRTRETEVYCITVYPEAPVGVVSFIKGMAGEAEATVPAIASASSKEATVWLIKTLLEESDNIGIYQDVWNVFTDDQRREVAQQSAYTTPPVIVGGYDHYRWFLANRERIADYVEPPDILDYNVQERLGFLSLDHT